MATSRRDFIKTSAVVAAAAPFASPAASYKRILGANDRINLAFMGCGRRVGAYYESLQEKYNTRLLYLCDVKKSRVSDVQKELTDQIDYTSKVKVEEDIRKILDDKKVDAIMMATPDHWHAPGACMAMDADKHVYLEKPCAHNPREGEVLVAKQKSTGKVVQMGNQQRSSDHTIEIVNEIHNGAIGVPYKAVAFYSNKRGEVPRPVKQTPPADLNWELFQGPAPRQEYIHNVWDYNWHWYGWKWGTAEAGNNGIHELDVARWALKADYPERVNVNAMKTAFLEDGWEMYDMMYASFLYEGGIEIVWDGKSRNGYKTYGTGRGVLIYGSDGSVFVNRNTYVLRDRGGVVVKESETMSKESGTALGGGGDLSTRHVDNFLQTIRGKEELTAPIHDGAISNHLAMLANLSYKTGKNFEVDTATGRAKDDEVMKQWGRSYEPGWEIE